MRSFFACVFNNKVLAAAVSGVAFLTIVLAIRAIPRQFVAEVQIEAIRAPQFQRDATTESTVPTRVSPGDRPGLWRVEMVGPSRDKAADMLFSFLESWRSQADAAVEPLIETPDTAAARVLLAEKKKLLAVEKQRNEEAARKIEALDAAAFALRARMRAVAADEPESGDPLGELLRSLRALQAPLVEAFPPDHPGLARLSRDIAQLEAASMPQAEAMAVARRLALFRTQLESLLKRYPSSHPEVQRKTAELEAMQQRLRSLREGSPPILPLYGEVDVAKRERKYWEYELQALRREQSRWEAGMGRVSFLEREVADLEAAISNAKPQAAPAPAFRLVTDPVARAVSDAPRYWVPWGLAAAFLAGLLAALRVHGGGTKVWAPQDMPSGPWQDGVFHAPLIPTPRTRRLSVLKATLALLPWTVALALFS